METAAVGGAQRVVCTAGVVPYQPLSPQPNQHHRQGAPYGETAVRGSALMRGRMCLYMRDT